MSPTGFWAGRADRANPDRRARALLFHSPAGPGGPARPTPVGLYPTHLEAYESERLKKRPRAQTSHSQTAVNSNDLLSLSDNRATQLSDNTLLTRDLTQSSNRMRNAEERPISLPMRSGRTTRLPARFL